MLIGFSRQPQPTTHEMVGPSVRHEIFGLAKQLCSGAVMVSWWSGEVGAPGGDGDLVK